MTRFALCCLCVAALSCTRTVGPPREVSLVGVTLPLAPSPGVHLAVEGRVNSLPGVVTLDVGLPLTVVSEACLLSPAYTGSEVVLHEASEATPLKLPLARVDSLELGPIRLPPRVVAVSATRRCVVRLGRDVLSGLALKLELESRRVTFLASRPKSAWLDDAAPEGREVRVVDLSRHPTHDWPMVPVRVRQGEARVTETFALTTREWVSRIVMRGGPLGRAPDAQVADEAGASSVAFDVLELAPDFGVMGGALVPMAEAAPGIDGLLASDVWGRFDAVLDVEADVLLLSRPRVELHDGAPRCLGRDGYTADACFRLRSEATVLGLLTTVTSWQPLEAGGRVYLDVEGVGALPCRIGVSFSPGAGGRSAQHRFPWKRLADAMPWCVGALHQAKSASLAFFERGPLEECPGVCGFAVDLRTGRVLCECQAAPAEVGTAVDQRFLDAYRQVRHRDGPAEPVDPD
ncbi:MAG: hypothetical protein JNG84_04860 [Archangium sp.]|nr:hypothetical protein [Archangium sp.]